MIVTAPAAFRFTYEAPERHDHVAELLAGEPISDAAPTRCPTSCAS